MELRNGTKLGCYEILGPLGSGGMGEVYKALDTRLGRPVAIKMLAQHLGATPEARQRLEREARVVSNLSDPHICILHDVGSHDGIDFLVMEYLEGGTLAQRISRGPLPVPELLEIAVEIAGALATAHRQGVLHRDLKPGNIMLTKSGAKLMDFGLARAAVAPAVDLSSAPTSSRPLVRNSSDEPLTAKGTVLGTFQYMAPEIIEGHEAGPQSDIFSFGAVLYEMASGHKAFDGKSPASVMAAILEREPASISALQPMTPAGLEQLVKECLAKNPEERWQSIHDVKLALQGLQARWSKEEGLKPRVNGTASREKFAWSLALLLLAASSFLAWNHFKAAPHASQTVRSSILPPVSSSFLPYNFAISPDGARLAFVGVGADGGNSLWVRNLSAASARQLNGTEDATFPFWSPDGLHVGFFADAKLKTVDVSGGAVKVLCEAQGGRGGTWNREGVVVFARDIAGPLYRISASGGTATPVTNISRAESGQGHRWPYFLPDGKHFLYVIDWSSPGDAEANGTYVGSLDGGPGKLIFAELYGNVVYASGNLIYVRDRTLTAQPFDAAKLEISGPAISIADQELEKHTGTLQSSFAASQNGVMVFQSATDSPSRLIWFDAAGKELGQLAEAGYRDPSFSPDGRFLALSSDSQHNGKHYISVYDVARGVTTRLTDNGKDEHPVWSADGKQIAYDTIDGQSYLLNEIAGDGSAPATVLMKGVKTMANDWSRKGELLFMNFARGLPFVAVYSQDSKQVRELASGAEAKFSPDGNWVVMIGTRGHASSALFVERFPGPGGRIQISSGGGAQPRWSRDGKQIFYIAPDRKLMAVSFDAKSNSAGAPRILFQTRIVAPNFDFFQYDVAPDGRFLINSFPANHSSPLTVLMDWTAMQNR